MATVETNVPDAESKSLPPIRKARLALEIEVKRGGYFTQYRDDTTTRYETEPTLTIALTGQDAYRPIASVPYPIAPDACRDVEGLRAALLNALDLIRPLLKVAHLDPAALFAVEEPPAPKSQPAPVEAGAEAQPAQ